MMINSFNHFRAVSILFIVAGHSYYAAGLQFDSIIEQVVANVITGGTSLFVFISGFLFHYVFYSRYSYIKFVKSKFKNVLVPYLLLGLAPVLLHVLLKKDVNGEFFLPASAGIVGEYLIPTIKYYWTGGFLIAYWYIPFIIMTFLLSPIHFAFIRARFGVQMTLVLTLSLVSLLIHRPVDNLSVIQSVVYFTPVYLIGIMFSIHREVVYRVLSGKEVYLLLAIFSISTIQAISGQVGNYHKEPFVYDGLDLMYLQKILLCIFFMVWLNRFESYNNTKIHALAATSFTIFFLHPFLIWMLERSVVWLDFDGLQSGSWFVYLAMVMSITVVCVAVAKLTKRILPSYSRYMIGY